MDAIASPARKRPEPKAKRARYQCDETDGLPEGAAECWEIVDMPEETLEKVALWLLLKGSGIDDKVDSRQVNKFVKAVRSGYGNVPFHNWCHVVDVAHTLWYRGKLMEWEKIFTDGQRFALLAAALCHDIGHPGVDNAFLIEVEDKIALAHNDDSPLERMHCCRLFDIANKPGQRVFAHMAEPERKQVRRLIIEAILHTDFQKHHGMVQKLQMLFDENPAAFAEASDEEARLQVLRANSQLVANMLLHGADISNPTKPWPTALKWGRRVMEEFFAQGDEEKKRAIPIPVVAPRDRERDANIPSKQLGFIHFAVAPWVAIETRLFPCFREAAMSLAVNAKEWERLSRYYFQPQRWEGDETLKQKVQDVVAMLKIEDGPLRPPSPAPEGASRQLLADSLLGVSFIQALELDATARGALVDACRKRQLEEKEVLIKKGDVLQDGQAALYVLEFGELQAKGEPPKTYSTPGDVLGEIALQYGLARLCTVIATKPSSVWAVSRTAFFEAAEAAALQRA